tara:strand:+ start:437 stop:1432 length:996 start_codon:yes stop_codon:yes gene_type:complete
MATGSSQNGNFDLMSGTNLISTFTQGSEPELFDLRPMNQCSWDTSSESGIRADHILANMDTGGGFNVDFVAILNHNMHSADAKFSVGHSGTESNVNQDDMTGDTNVASVVDVVNGGGITGNVVTPTADGSTIITFDANSDRYWGIQFEGSSALANNAGGGYSFNGSVNLKIGCIIFGEFYDMPHSPDLSVKRSIMYDGVSVQESIGGQRYGNATHRGRRYVGQGNQTPFVQASQGYYVYGGRMSYDMSFSYLGSDVLMPSDYKSEVSGSDTVVADVWNRTSGNLLPFIFTTDGSSTSESDYLFARFAQNSLDMTQVAPDVFNTSMKIEEEF